jgi:hypothetical protein
MTHTTKTHNGRRAARLLRCATRFPLSGAEPATGRLGGTDCHDACCITKNGACATRSSTELLLAQSLFWNRVRASSKVGLLPGVRGEKDRRIEVSP